MSVVNSRLIRSANFSLFGLEDFSLSPESIVVFALCFLRDFCCACANSSEPRSVRTSVPRISYSESAPTMPERDASRGSRPPLHCPGVGVIGTVDSRRLPAAADSRRDRTAFSSRRCSASSTRKIPASTPSRGH